MSLLVGDIGGTHGRFALAEDDDGRLFEAAVEQGDAHDTFEDAVAAYLANGRAGIDRAAFAVAGPVTDGRRARITNRRNWIVDSEALEARFGFRRVIVMNDFVAQAASLPHLDAADVVAVGDPAPMDRAPKVAVGPGTGLGVAALLPEIEGWRPVGGEGGHVDLAAADEREWRVFEALRRAHGRVEAETVLSGPGLVRLHAAMAVVDGRAASAAAAPEIVDAAKAAKPDAVETVALFLNILARFTGDLALTFGAAGGVYVCGGVMPRLLPLLDQTAFRAAFEDKAPHRELMRGYATAVVASPLAGLIGCAAEARRLA